MMGMKMANQGPGRQVADKSYYMGELRKKCDEMQKEIAKMQSETEQYNKDNQTYTLQERKYEALIKEVRKLQGDFADLNLIVDKSRTKTDPQDIAQAYQMLKARNDHESQKLDGVFSERREKEEDTKQVEEQLRQVQMKAEEKLNTLSQEQRMQYAQLQDDFSRIEADIEQKRATYDNLCRQVAKFEQSLAQEPNKQRMNSLQDQMQQLIARKRELEAAANKPVLSESEQREQLLQQVKEDNAHIATLTRNVEEKEKRIVETQKELDALEAGGGEETEEVKKYRKLQEKDQEMTEFIEQFDEKKKRELEAVVEVERRVVALMEHVSKQLGRSTQVPSKEGFQDLQSEVAYKQRNLENSQSTAERLAQEEEMRKAELEKINNLDTKITKELANLQERRKTMQEELVTFNNIAGLRTEAEQTRAMLVRRKGEFDVRRKGLKSQVQQVSIEYDKIKQKLASDETAMTLEALEQKLRHHQQNIFHLRDFIESKEAETDFSQVYEEVSKQVADVNGMLQQISGRVY
jgi:intraflagellar transport protein 74